MSTTDQPQTESASPIPEELVAYLDGELSPDDCRRVEERLASDADCRQQLRELDQAWEALDSLPSTAVDDDFARTTIEMVALAARQEQQQRMTQFATAGRSRRRLWAAALIAAAVVSFIAARLLLPDANAKLVGDLPVITQMDLLRQIQDVGFLRSLDQEIPLDESVADEAAAERNMEQFQAASDTSPEQRRQWIESLSPDERANLAAQAKQFEALPEDERGQLRKLEQEIAADGEADQLLRTLSAYGQWLTRRTNAEQSKLRSLGTDDRIRRIGEFVKEEQLLAARRLNPDNAEQLRHVIFQIYDDHKNDFVEDNRRRRLDGPPEVMALIVAQWALWNKDVDGGTRKRIVAKLTPEAQRHLEQLSHGRDGQRRVRRQLWRWMHDAMRPQREVGDLEKFFAEKLDDEQRERLLSLPRDQMEAELEQMYLGSRFGLQGVEWLGGFGDPRRGPGSGGPGQPGWRSNGPPPFSGPDRERFDRNRRGPDDRRGRPDDRRDGGAPPDRPPFPPPDGGPIAPPPPGPGQEDPI